MSKLWLVKNYPSPRNEGEVGRHDPEKYKVKQFTPDNKGVLSDSFKEFVGLIYEHQEGGGLVGGSYAIPIMTYNDVNNMLGKILSFIDATHSDKEQKEATKKFLTRIVWDYYNDLQRRLETDIKWAKEVKEV